MHKEVVKLPLSRRRRQGASLNELLHGRIIQDLGVRDLAGALERPPSLDLAVRHYAFAFTAVNRSIWTGTINAFE